MKSILKILRQLENGSDNLNRIIEKIVTLKNFQILACNQYGHRVLNCLIMKTMDERLINMLAQNVENMARNFYAKWILIDIIKDVKLKKIQGATVQETIILVLSNSPNSIINLAKDRHSQLIIEAILTHHPKGRKTVLHEIFKTQNILVDLACHQIGHKIVLKILGLELSGIDWNYLENFKSVLVRNRQKLCQNTFGKSVLRAVEEFEQNKFIF